MAITLPSLKIECFVKNVGIFYKMDGRIVFKPTVNVRRKVSSFVMHDRTLLSLHLWIQVKVENSRFSGIGLFNGIAQVMNAFQLCAIDRSPYSYGHP